MEQLSKMNFFAKFKWSTALLGSPQNYPGVPKFCYLEMLDLLTKNQILDFLTKNSYFFGGTPKYIFFQRGGGSPHCSLVKGIHFRSNMIPPDIIVTDNIVSDIITQIFFLRYDLRYSSSDIISDIIPSDIRFKFFGHIQNSKLGHQQSNASDTISLRQIF